MFKFDSEAFIKEMESLESVEEAPLDYEEFEIWLNINVKCAELRLMSPKVRLSLLVTSVNRSKR